VVVTPQAFWRPGSKKSIPISCGFDYHGVQVAMGVNLWVTQEGDLAHENWVGFPDPSAAQTVKPL
jgi:hypothetical protein